MKKQASFRCAGINIVCQHFEGNAALIDVGCGFDNLGQGPRQSGQLPDDKRIAFTEKV